MKLIECRTLRPLALFGRILGTHERVRLPEVDALELIERGYLVEINVLSEVNGSDQSRWVQPVER